MKLKYRDNWAMDEYFIKGKEIKDLKVVEIDGYTYPVHSRTVGVSYSEQGIGESVAYSKHFFIETSFHGIFVELDLNRIVPNKTVKAMVYETV